MAPPADPVKLALERAAQRAARVAVLDAAGQEPEPSDLPGACARKDKKKDPKENAQKKAPAKACRGGDASQDDADEVSTVGAGDEEARESAAAALAMKTPEQNKKAQPRLSMSSQPKLDRAVQSKQVLAENQEKGNEKLKRKAPLAIQNAQPSVKQLKATAVKAKATKPEPAGSTATAAKSENQPSPSQVKPECTALAVSEGLPTAEDSCLARATTTELNNGDTTEVNNGRKNNAKPMKQEVLEQDPPEPSDPGSSDSEDEEQVKKIKKSKEAHARYMRFSRSLKSPKTPVEIRRAGAAAHHKSHHLQVLLEQWLACAGQWRASEFYYQVCQKKRSRKHGCRKWLTRSEIGSKYGSLSTADSIISQKMNDPDICREQVRCHPDMHGVDSAETRQYLVWDQDGEEETEDLVTSQLFEAADRDDDEGVARGKKKTAGKKNKKGKVSKKKGTKKKKAKCSSSDSDESSEESSSSSSSKKSTASSTSEESKKSKKNKGRSAKSKKNTGKKNKSPIETEEQKAKRMRKEEEAAEKAEEKKREADAKAEEKKKEAERKAAEKKIVDAHKKECKKAEQVIDKITLAIHKSTSLQGGRLASMSTSVQAAISEELKPQVKKLKTARSDLQQDKEASKAGEDLSDLTSGISKADDALKDFNAFLKSYNLK